MRRGLGRPAWPRWSALAPVVVALWWLVPASAHAEEPLDLDDEITDRVGALEGREDDVQAAIDDLYEAHRLQLFVVYVDDFSDRSAEAWADETAERNGLSVNDALLAVATRERTYAISVDQDYPLTDDELAEVQTVAVDPALRANDWAGAAIGAAQGLEALRSGEPVAEPAITPGEADPSAGGGATPWIVGGVAAAAVAATGLVLARRSRRGQRGDGVDQEPVADLERRAGALLVETDEAIRTSEQELGFATAQFGEEAAAPFAAALADAKSQLAASFALRQELDDATPEDEPTRRRMLAEIIDRCERAGDRLDQEAEAFDRLRDLERNAPDVLAGVAARAAALEPRLDAAGDRLRVLSATYGASALAPVADNADEASARLDFARTAAGSAQDALGSGRTGEAAVQIRAAEQAVGQAGELLDALDRHGADLDEAATTLQAAIADLDHDLVEARAMLANPAASGADTGLAAELGPAVAVADDAVAAAKAEAGPGGRPVPADPLAVLRRVRDAGAGLDRALAGVRDRRARADRARASLDRALVAARSEIAAASDFIATRRGAVGSEARTRLAEAQRHLDRAVELGPGDPEAALAAAQQADALAEQAGARARSDVGQFSPAGVEYGGAFGRQSGSGLGSAVLGGILGSMLGGGGRSSGVSWGSGRSGSFRPRSGGGRSSARRGGRRGGSGRF